MKAIQVTSTFSAIISRQNSITFCFATVKRVVVELDLPHAVGVAEVLDLLHHVRRRMRAQRRERGVAEACTFPGQPRVISAFIAGRLRYVPTAGK